MQPSRPVKAPGGDPLGSLSADELLSPEEVLDRRRRRRWLIALPLAALLAAGVWFGSRPALHAVKAWQARRAAAEVERLTGEHKWAEAKAKLQDALLLWHQEPAALRAAAIFLAAIGDSREAASFWKQLEAERRLSQDEQRDYSESLAKSGDLEAAEAHLRQAWPSGKTGTPADWTLGMNLAARRDRAPEAANLARQLLASCASTLPERLAAAVTLLSGSPDAQRLAWEEIRTLASGPASPASLDALVLLARHALASSRPGIDSPASAAGAARDSSLALPGLADRLEAHPLTKIQHRLLAIDLRLAQDPARSAQWIQTAMDRFAGTKDDAGLVILGAWLYERGEYARVLEAIPPARAAGDRPLFFQRLDALGALNRWSEIQDGIQGGKPALDPMIAQMYLARCADKSGDPLARDARWDAALDAAAGSPEKLVELGQYARKNGAVSVAERAFHAALEADPRSREAYGAIIELLEAQGKTSQLRETLAKMLTVWPQDNAVRNDDSYFDALLNEDVPTALATALQLVRVEPASLPHRVTLALAELRSGNDLAALDAFGGIKISQGAMQPRQRAVYAAVLWASSYNREAIETLRGVPAEDLLPEERLLVQPIQEAMAAQ